MHTPDGRAAAALAKSERTDATWAQRGGFVCTSSPALGSRLIRPLGCRSEAIGFSGLQPPPPQLKVKSRFSNDLEYDTRALFFSLFTQFLNFFKYNAPPFRVTIFFYCCCFWPTDSMQKRMPIETNKNSV